MIAVVDFDRINMTWLSFFLLFSLVIKDGENRSEVSHPSRKTDGKSKIKG
jgi:hypothetical protein